MVCRQHAKVFRSTRKNPACSPQALRGAPGLGWTRRMGLLLMYCRPLCERGRLIERSAPEGRRQRRGFDRQRGATVAGCK